MSLAEAYEADLRGLVEELENQDVFAPGEAEAWYDGLDEADVVSDYMMVNEAIKDILDERDGFDQATRSMGQNDTNSFF